MEELVKVQLSFPAFEINNRAAKVGGSCDSTRSKMYMRNGLQHKQDEANSSTKGQPVTELVIEFCPLEDCERNNSG